MKQALKMIWKCQICGEEIPDQKGKFSIKSCGPNSVRLDKYSCPACQENKFEQIWIAYPKKCAIPLMEGQL